MQKRLREKEKEKEKSNLRGEREENDEKEGTKKKGRKISTAPNYDNSAPLNLILEEVKLSLQK